jgi:hypothetical protein
LVDGRLDLGTWTRLGLMLFLILGPLGAVLEGLLLVTVLRDILAQRRRTHPGFPRRRLKPRAIHH